MRKKQITCVVNVVNFSHEGEIFVFMQKVT